MEAIHQVLRREAGFEPDLLGIRAIESGVRRRIGAVGAEDPSAYLNVLRTSADEVARLVEEVIVPETWFFRDAAPFDYLEHWVATDWTGRGRNATLRALSAGCSTGEEAYSMAAALLGAGLGQGQVSVLGVDISRKSIEHARRGQYRKRILRPGLSTPYERFFQRRPSGGLAVGDLLKSCVRFEQANLVSRGFFTGRGPFDVIFCRNVLIYADEPARDRLFVNLDRLLEPDGLLFVGHSEPVRVPRARFEVTGPFGAYAFRRCRAGRPYPPLVSRRQPKPVLTRIDWGPPPALPPHREDALTDARRLADRGLLQEASDLCERELSDGAPNAEAYCILGIIAQAEGRVDEAENLFHKAVYLDGNHEAALFHLALIAEGKGDSRGARVLRRRAERASRPEAGA